MEYISIWILKICVFVYATELQNVQLLSVPEPCPEYAKSTTIADMCTNDFAIEEQINGGVTIDSVALRVMTQQDGCTCEVGLRNQTKMQTIYMRKYDLLTRAAPLDTACGLAIGISYTIPENFPENKTSIECTKGISTRSVSLLPTGILNLRSRIIGGNFIRGYCIQIYRQHITGENVGIQINCSLSNIQTTQQMTDAASDDKIVSDKHSTLYIAIGVGFAVIVITLFVVVAIIILRRKSNKNKYENDIQPDNECTDYDSDGLKYNILYNASEQQDIMEGDYNTVQLEVKQNTCSTGIQNLGSDYSTDDGNYSSVDIVNMPTTDGSETDSINKSTTTTTPRSETQRTEGDTSINLKHVTPMADSNVEYAVVDKSGITDEKVKHISAPNDSNVEYAVIDKK